MKNKLHKILLISHEMTYTGAPRSLLDLAKVLRDLRYHVDVWTLEDGPFSKEFSENGFSIERINFPNQSSKEMAKKLKNYFCVIANTVFCSKIAYYTQRYTQTILYIREAKNLPECISNCSMDSLYIREANNIICVSEYAKDFITREYGPKNVHVIHNFVNDIWDENYEIKNNKIRFIISGTVEPRKGHLVTFRAYEKLSESIRINSEFHVIGRVPEWAEEYREELSFHDKEVIYHDAIENYNQLIDFYKTMDVFLIPSFDESCSRVALEAAMLGKCILLSGNVGAQYLVDSSAIVKNNISTEWMKQMEKVIIHPDQIKKMGIQNRQFYLMYGTRIKYIESIRRYLNGLILKQSKKGINSVYPEETGDFSNEELYKYQLLETQKSISFKIGRAITWLPRKIRGW